MKGALELKRQRQQIELQRLEIKGRQLELERQENKTPPAVSALPEAKLDLKDLTTAPLGDDAEKTHGLKSHSTLGDTFVTGGMINGRFWKNAETGMKQGYLLASKEASIYAGVISKEPLDLGFPKRLSPIEVLTEVDLFYEQGTNVPVPVLLVLSYVQLKAMGEDEDRLKAFAARLRLTASELGAAIEAK